MHSKPLNLSTKHSEPLSLSTMHSNIIIYKSKPLNLSTMHSEPLNLSIMHFKPLNLSTMHFKPLNLSSVHSEPLNLSYSWGYLHYSPEGLAHSWLMPGMPHSHLHDLHLQSGPDMNQKLDVIIVPNASSGCYAARPQIYVFQAADDTCSALLKSHARCGQHLSRDGQE